MVSSVLVALAVFALAGCATPINWQARVGAYTYNQAVMDYGPPFSYTRLGDGSIVVEWMTERGEVLVTPGPYAYGPVYYGRGFYGPAYVGPGWGGYTSTYFPARFLRLQFGADGKLKAWKEFSK